MIQQNACGLFVGRVQANHGMRLASDRFTQVATVVLAQRNRTLLHQLIEVAHQDLVGITQSLMDLTSRMASVQPLHVDTEIL